ncbi:MAG: hypothetical protein WBB07_03550 [Mycobacterium sp.]
MTGVAGQEDRLTYMDQASFLSLRAVGRALLGQLAWVYHHPVDYDGLRRFHDNFGHGLAGRLIEPSVLPFGRHRWVAASGPQADLDIAESPRPPEELGTWLDEQAQTPVDPEFGPGWRLAVQPMTDGSTAVSLVISHSLTDGLGLLLTVADAANGKLRDFGYPPPASRTRRQALVADARQTVRDMPELGRTLVAAAKLFYRRRKDFVNAGASRASVTPADKRDENVIVPTVALFIPEDEWDARANALGGNSYSLLAGFGSRLADRMGRHRPDGTVSLLVAMSDRAEDDTRANAVTIANVVVDPVPVTSDLSGVRAAMKQGLQTMREVPDETFALLALTPFVPKRAVRRSADVMFGDLPVSCSNLGQLDPAVGRPDGTDAEYFMLRAVDQNVTRDEIERVGGQLVVVSGRIGGKVTIGVVGYQNGGTNTSAALRELAQQTLAEFGVAGEAI